MGEAGQHQEGKDMIDWSKPLRTIKGHHPARLLGRVNRKAYPIVVAVTGPYGEETLYSYAEDGRAGTVTMGLENVPEKVTVWTNVFRSDGGYLPGGFLYATKEEALSVVWGNTLYVTTCPVTFEVP